MCLAEVRGVSPNCKTRTVGLFVSRFGEKAEGQRLFAGEG